MVPVVQRAASHGELFRIQPCIQPITAHQFPVGSLVQDPPLGKHDQTVGGDDGAQAMRNDECCAPPGKTVSTKSPMILGNTNPSPDDTTTASVPKIRRIRYGPAKRNISTT